MYSNYIKLALRNMAKHRLYAAINVLGLGIGLTVFLLSTILAHYERNHDSMFSKRDRIFTAGSVFAADADIMVTETDSIYTAMEPLIRSELQDVEAIARTVRWEYLVSLGNGMDSYYQRIHFADPDLLKIFDFRYLYGDAGALSDPTGIVLSESIARKYFGRTDVLGEVVTLDHKHDLHVTAVIAYVPPDSHFTNNLTEPSFSLWCWHPYQCWRRFRAIAWRRTQGRLSMGDLTYMLLPADRDGAWLRQQSMPSTSAMPQRISRIYHQPAGLRR
ncbi:MAG: ABC transporter permease [Halioglobus sp.]